MRTRAAAAVLLFVLASCTPPPAVFVHTARVGSGQRSEPEIGNAIKWGRITSPEQSGHKPGGVYLLRSQPEWDQFFADSPRRVRSGDIDWGDVSVLAVYSTDPTALRIEATNVIDSGSAYHVYLHETYPGENCPSHSGDPAFELVTLPRAEKAVHVHIDNEREEACDALPPNAQLACRVIPGMGWAQRITANVGDNIECAAASKTRTGPIVDQNWLFTLAPKGSAAKLTFDEHRKKARFPIDAVGRYVIQVEAVDADGRRGDIEAVIEATTPTNETYLEQIWTKVLYKGDELPKIPRVELHALDITQGRRDCAAEVEGKRASCDVQRVGTTTWIRFHSDASARYAVFARYLDDRAADGPLLCVRTIANKNIAGQQCDDQPRKAGAVWEIGTLEEKTGVLEQK